MELKSALLKLIKKEVRPAMGCTEPIAVTLAAAKASEIVREAGETVERIEVSVDPNVFKNGLGVYVPKTNMVGLTVAAAMGVIGGKSKYGLEVLQDVTDEDIKNMHKYLNEDRATVKVEGKAGQLQIDAVAYGKSVQGEAKILGEHDSFVLFKQDEKILFEKELNIEEDDNSLKEFVFSYEISEMLDIIEEFSEEELAFLLDGALMNMEVAEAGLKHEAGLGVGAKLKRQMEKGYLADDLTNKAVMYTAAASDARMRGFSLPVMTTNGSGNQGIVSTIPVYVAAKELGIEGLTRLKALAISQTLTIMVKSSIGLLSALCACTIAAPIGTAAGIIYLMHGKKEHVEAVVQSISADITGAICDGAKPGCALKVASGVATAIRHVFMVLEGLDVSETNGIVGKTAKESIKNLGLLSKTGMLDADKAILKIMQDK
ncbi:MAG: serine dehydratase subunit alpha family protein [Clostridia bacterium]